MMTDEADLWGDTLPPTTIPASKTNPCIAVYGPGPADTHCTDCTHLRRMQRDKTYIKCDLRKRTHGAGTDHRALWPTCARFNAREEATA